MSDELYRPGYSFENAPVVRFATKVKSQPWFFQDTAVGPLTAVSKLQPFWHDGVLHKYQPVWNRVAKMRNTERLGAYFTDIPTMEELGQAPPATSVSTTTSRSATGFLDNMITGLKYAATGAREIVGTVTGELQKREELKAQTAAAQLQTYLRPYVPTGPIGDAFPFILGALGIGAVAYFMLRK